MPVEDSLLRKYIDLAIFSLNPSEKWQAHVTVAGPFTRKVEIPRALSFLQQISIMGPGRFDNGAYQTVYLQVDGRDLLKHINKPDYRFAVPHLSIYNGKDKVLADKLFNEISSIGLYGRFYTTSFRVVESKSQLGFEMAFGLDTSLLEETRGMSIDDFKTLNTDQRVSIAVKALKVGITERFYDRLET